MCIAIYSPVGTETPSEKYLHTSYENNPDGAGFAFNTDDGRVKILKGFMTWESFLETYKTYHDKYDFKNRGVLIHFRITTHGGTCPECTHPFPLTSDAGTLQKLSSTSEYAVIHNGIISLTGTEAHKLTHMSDTMVFISKYMSKIASYKNWFNNPVTFELIYDLAESKIAVLRGDGTIKSTYGFTKDEEDGNFYSNDTYKTARVKYTTKYLAPAGYPYSYYKSGWDDYYDEDDYYSKGYYGSAAQSAAKESSPASVPLMKLTKGDIICEGSFDYPVTGDDSMLYFVDSSGTVYYMYIEDEATDIAGKYIKDGLMTFADNCTIVTSDGKPKGFETQFYANPKNII